MNGGRYQVIRVALMVKMIAVFGGSIGDFLPENGEL